MHRRQLLVGMGAAGAALLVPGCGSAGPPAADAPSTLFVVNASQGFVAERENRLAVGIIDRTGTPMDGAEVEAFLRTVPTNLAESEPEVIAGPFPLTWADPAEAGAQGLYHGTVELGEPGFYEIVAIVGDEHGTASFQVLSPEDDPVPAPGEQAPSAPTATFDDDLGTFAVCTQDPPCGMHEISLDEALETGRPVVVMFATPQFCQTAVCGPSVATLDRVREEGDWGDTIFIHSEIFAEEPSTGATGDGEVDPAAAAGTPLREAVLAYALASEPWIFAIDGDGVVADRHDGGMPASILTGVISSVSA